MGRRRRKTKAVSLAESCSPSSSFTSRALVMETTTEAKGKRSLHHRTPWMDLHDYVYEKILEKLPLSDYIRFAAVCKKWQSIQTNHKLLYAPYPPPLLPIPWAIPSSKPGGGGLKTVLIPFEGRGRTYRLPNPLMLPDQTRPLFHIGTGTGWLLLLVDDDDRVGSLYLHNPISRQSIKLPPLHLSEPFGAGFVSPPPRFVVFIRTSNVMLLIREEDNDWTPLTPSYPAFWSPHSTIFCGGNLYSLLYLNNKWNLCCICPHPTPTIEYLEMENLEMNKSELLMIRGRKFNCLGMIFLVESKGEVLVVLGLEDDRDRMGFRVFRADLSKRKWIEMESLGDRLLLLTWQRCVFVPASDLGNGFVKNSILFYDSFAKSWMIFKLGFDEGMDFLDSPFVDDSISMFVPTLC